MMQYKWLRNAALTKPARDKKYLEWLREQPCCLCDRPPRSEPHHIYGSVHGMKSSDYGAVPVCRECHNFYEQNPKENAGLVEHQVVCLMRYLTTLRENATMKANVGGQGHARAKRKR